MFTWRDLVVSIGQCLTDFYLIQWGFGGIENKNFSPIVIALIDGQQWVFPGFVDDVSPDRSR